MNRICIALFCLCLSACGYITEPPVADSDVDSPEQEENTEMRDAIQAPIQKAEDVEDQVLEGAEEQAEKIEEAGG